MPKQFAMEKKKKKIVKLTAERPYLLNLKCKYIPPVAQIPQSIKMNKNNYTNI